MPRLLSQRLSPPSAPPARAGAGAAWLIVELITQHRALCFYCLLASTATWAELPQALPEANDAWRTLRG